MAGTTTLILGAIGAFWLFATVVVVALCRGAALADRELDSRRLRLVPSSASGFAADQKPRAAQPVAAEHA